LEIKERVEESKLEVDIPKISKINLSKIKIKQRRRTTERKSPNKKRNKSN